METEPEVNDAPQERLQPEDNQPQRRGRGRSRKISEASGSDRPGDGAEIRQEGGEAEQSATEAEARQEVVRPFQPTLVYIGKGPHARPGGTFNCRSIRSAGELADAMAAGWHETLPAAIEAQTR